MVISRADILAKLDDLGLAHRTVDHEAIMTVDEGRALKASMPGGHSKNLFLKDKKGALFLVSAHCDTSVDLVSLGKALGARGRLSFGKPDLMMETLGVAPGSVTPFALAAGAKNLTAFVLDQAFFAHDPIWFHPMENTASTAVSPAGLVSFARAYGVEPIVLDPASPSPTGL